MRYIPRKTSFAPAAAGHHPIFTMHMRSLFCLLACLAAAGCSSNSSGYFQNDGPPSAFGHIKALGSNNITIKVEEPHKWANRPYTVLGKRYVPITGDKPMTQVGEASWYGKQFHGKKTSTGEIYDMYELSAAHKTMELPSYARVTNLKNGRSVIVRVNDRGPFVDGRVIDLSYAAAVQLGYQKQGITQVRVERITMKDIAAGRIPSTNASDIMLAKASTTASTKAPVKTTTKVAAAAPARPTIKETTSAPAPVQSAAVRKSSAAASTASAGRSTSTSTSTSSSASTGVGAGALVAAGTAAVVPSTSRAPQSAASEKLNLSGEELAAADDPREPAVTISLTVEETGADEAQAMQTYSKLQEHASDETPAGTGAQSAQTVVAGDPISAIVAEQEAIDAERAAKEKARLEALERSREAAVIPDGWTVQIGAFGVRENATAAAAHAEMMLSQQQQTGAGTVRVIDTGSMFRVVVGSVPSQQEAIALAKNVSSALGSSAYAIAEPAAQATAKP